MLSPALQPPCRPGQAVKELQTSTREAIVLLKAMIEEVRNSASEEEAAINSLFSRMQVRGGHLHIQPCAPGQSQGSGKGLGWLQDTGWLCHLQEQLSERKKTLLKAVQR